MESNILINGKKLHISFCGDSANPPLLFIHGIPGLGSMDFMYFQQEYLRKHFFIIAPDQRGVWKSEPLDIKEAYSIPQIIKDYEEIRRYFGISSWSCISHSFGARILTDYLKTDPNSINKVIFESPIFDLSSPLIEILKVQLAILKKQTINIDSIIQKIVSIQTIPQLKDLMSQVEKMTGITSNGITMSKETIQELTKLKSKFDITLFMNSRRTELKVSNNKKLFASRFQQYPSFEKKALFIKGDKDPSVSLSSLSKYRKLFINSKITNIRNAKHWVHIDAPVLFNKIITTYMLM